ncbi:hypothetical protein OUZ56_009789 [Daphnia magna]|uniref:Uncharacterized protein n=1 Tax=Daphnia magna TaxID=35525 RepID=A0ABR0AGW7_9CRUS|nr:hypothetical protein OUZ56_009789 [Daphnia magna]
MVGVLLFVGNRPIQPIALPTTDEIDLNKLTPEEDSLAIEGAHRNSYRGSIPVIVEEVNLLSTPDDDDKEQGIGLDELVFADREVRDGGSLTRAYRNRTDTLMRVQTTNYVDGWHTHLAFYAGLRISSRGFNLYILLDVFYEEAIQCTQNGCTFKAVNRRAAGTVSTKMESGGCKNLGLAEE